MMQCGKLLMPFVCISPTGYGAILVTHSALSRERVLRIVNSLAELVPLVEQATFDTLVLMSAVERSILIAPRRFRRNRHARLTSYCSD